MSAILTLHISARIRRQFPVDNSPSIPHSHNNNAYLFLTSFSLSLRPTTLGTPISFTPFPLSRRVSFFPERPSIEYDTKITCIKYNIPRFGDPYRNSVIVCTRYRLFFVIKTTGNTTVLFNFFFF